MLIAFPLPPGMNAKNVRPVINLLPVGTPTDRCRRPDRERGRRCRPSLPPPFTGGGGWLCLYFFSVCRLDRAEERGYDSHYRGYTVEHETGYRNVRRVQILGSLYRRKYLLV